MKNQNAPKLISTTPFCGCGRCCCCPAAMCATQRRWNFCMCCRKGRYPQRIPFTTPID
jgi:hypothetical protein